MNLKQHNQPSSAQITLPTRRKSRSAQKIKINTKGLPKDFFAVTPIKHKKAKTLFTIPSSLDYLNQTCYFRQYKEPSLIKPRQARNYKSEPRQFSNRKVREDEFNEEFNPIQYTFSKKMFTEDLKQLSQRAQRNEINSQRKGDRRNQILKRSQRKQTQFGWEQLPEGKANLNSFFKMRIGEGRPLILHQLRNIRKQTLPVLKQTRKYAS